MQGLGGRLNAAVLFSPRTVKMEFYSNAFIRFKPNSFELGKNTPEKEKP